MQEEKTINRFNVMYEIPLEQTLTRDMAPATNQYEKVDADYIDWQYHSKTAVFFRQNEVIAVITNVISITREKGLTQED